MPAWRYCVALCCSPTCSPMSIGYSCAAVAAQAELIYLHVEACITGRQSCPHNFTAARLVLGSLHEVSLHVARSQVYCCGRTGSARHLVCLCGCNRGCISHAVASHVEGCMVLRPGCCDNLSCLCVWRAMSARAALVASGGGGAITAAHHKSPSLQPCVG